MTEPSSIPVIVTGFGDGAVMVTIAAADASLRRQAVIVFRERLLARRPHGVVDVVSGLESLLVEFDPLETSVENLVFAVELLAELPVAVAATAPTRSFEIPFVVDENNAPDLADVAAELGVSDEEVVAMIEASSFRIALLAAAMAPMMDGLDVPRPVRRRAQPRTDVPAGAIMIAGGNAIIQPFAGPTGWRVVGRTPLTIVDITRERPVAFAPGDAVCFRRIDAADAVLLHGAFLEAAEVTA
ncbi:carboxyltransferase domain-containing protein [Microbacteriaceae bacterium VKM Ac-2854]|nr:carboxyltransferase domain-containing protein [Microbacteriaceae bacterium VKM Ac-2854]